MEDISAKVQSVVSWLSGLTGLSAGTILLLAASSGIAWAKKLAKVAVFVLLIAVLVFGYLHGWFAFLGADPRLYRGA
ncbi:hypothetical protein F8O07_06430 [Pseudoclavibacter sp. CFCC 13796]|uniref:hypothetical protein n=1 Tax=unclassified Pseudoclavibacter TaxID=2615177 RepID=UPI0013011D84|nr:MULTISPECIES: hypothetical protein [unclassified Pseudoclavibacter]KAB1661538.1 hypothetical protein F8O07_06430 [Pseudoclavibacter sp. CFCC 13796]MCD7100582.1 hypothetical protein [Pseudoclavibacter sp. 13-3]